MEFMEFQGKTVDEALSVALKELSTTKEKIEYEVIDHGNKGFLNFIGSKPAKIKVTLKRDYIEEARKFLTDILNNMKVEGKVIIKEEKGNININIEGPNMGIIIGYRGETLDSLQYLVSLVINKNHENAYKRVVLNTENYREKREETLRRLAQKTASRVVKNNKLFKLEPMNPYERRIIHSELQGNTKIRTFSEGEEPYRRVVIDINN
ncbi:RNA-binding cell elongation regulator Jag/EloR [Inconstantimicrobium mannanitabidum]|uniref:DNA/RNA-binding protein n=1 Tax=Inconstantimicrobium mannanitabidum TaxID=1604901 RepID=A0ACB5RH87_9CLOT|nr:RNA-binding cell elongation regulator Jag/EloR [Clostridium sp. TW13]GKX68442.1 DNA/RNA-binding protein [Clostridium sp. TW13]